MRRIERPLFGALVGLSLLACAEGIKPPEGTSAARIEGGTFTMGAEDRDPCSLATPGLLECDPLIQSEIIPHEVQVATFCIDTTEVTIEQYRHCVERGDCKKADITNAGRNNEASYIRRYYNEPDTFADFPVVGISHESAEDYCKFRGGRLPSEAEWEFAATSRGTRPTRVYGEGTGLDAQINVDARRSDGTLVNGCADSNGQIALGGCAQKFLPVGVAAKDATEQGVKDLAGNVSEWVADEFDFLAYCENRDGYIVKRPGGGQPNNIAFTNGLPVALSSAFSNTCEQGCDTAYGACEQICRASFGTPRVDCNDNPTPIECRFDVQRRDFQRRSCEQTARDAGATVANVVGLDAACDAADPAWCDGDPAACAAFCTCLAADPPGADFNGNACINTCLDDYAACFAGSCPTSATSPVATTCEFATKHATPWCLPRKGATGDDVRTSVPDNLAFREGQASWVVRGGSVADQLACLGRPTRRTVQNAPQALVGFRCAYDTGTPTCN